ncbi:MAG: WecB/TagA/CpsF family glycosyltransferase, partial [Lentisphaeria bacterium]|nr:WecB/TagA/CpsF family glycosyltransferase [Lentisphaeria bacterium]
IERHRAELRCGVALAVGGLLDFVSGRIPRAPLWMRRCGIEWMYRLYREPVRLFRRYVIGNPLFVLRLLVNK